MDLNLMPDVCLLLMFDLLPVHVQAHYRRVCRRWKTLIEERTWKTVFKISLTFKTLMLTIKIGERDPVTVTCGTLWKAKNPMNYPPFINAANFPAVTSLTFHQHVNSVPNQHNVCQCLAEWAGQLTHLDLYLTPDKSPYMIEGPSVQSKVWNMIRSMKSLKSLCLGFSELPEQRREFVELSIWKIPLNLSVLSKLDNFELKDSNIENGFERHITALHQLGPSLKTFKMNSTFQDNRRFLLNVAPQLVSLRCLTLNVAMSPMVTTAQWIATFNEHWAFLKKDLILLAKLTELESLTFEPADYYQFVTLDTPQKGNPISGSVKHLAIRHVTRFTKIINANEFKDFKKCFFECFPKMFPSLESIQVDVLRDDFNRTLEGELAQLLESMRQERMKLLSRR